MLQIPHLHLSDNEVFHVLFMVVMPVNVNTFAWSSFD